jgi:spore coat polysaccharide biosynthesis predicted glycosyltransferase SpsG
MKLDEILDEINVTEEKLKRLKTEYEKIVNEDNEKRPHYNFDMIPDVEKFQYPKMCSECGLVLEGVMGYVCNRRMCPTGLGGVWC